MSRVNHKNFVNLIGYCEEAEPFNRMMVFEYAPNGTLFEHLHGNKHLSLSSYQDYFNFYYYLKPLYLHCHLVQTRKWSILIGARG